MVDIQLAKQSPDVQVIREQPVTQLRPPGPDILVEQNDLAPRGSYVLGTSREVQVLRGGAPELVPVPSAAAEMGEGGIMLAPPSERLAASTQAPVQAAPAPAVAPPPAPVAPAPAPVAQAPAQVVAQAEAPRPKPQRVVIKSQTMGKHTVLVDRVAISENLVCIFYRNDGSMAIVEPPPAGTDSPITLVIRPGTEDAREYQCIYADWSVEDGDHLLVVFARI